MPTPETTPTTTTGTLETSAATRLAFGTSTCAGSVLVTEMAHQPDGTTALASHTALVLHPQLGVGLTIALDDEHLEPTSVQPCRERRVVVEESHR